MYFEFQRPLKELTQADVDWLIEEGVQESKYIDYKERFYEMKKDPGKISLCKDLCSFANASGGDLVVGVKEKSGQDKGKPAAITPLSEPFESLREWVLHVANARVKPRLNLDFKEIPIAGEDGKPNGIVFVIRVLPSFSEKPHLLPSGQDAFQYWVRADGQNSPVTDHQEIRRAFLDSEVYEERIRNWRSDRLAKIVSDETPIQLEGPRRLVLHIIPILSFLQSIQLDLDKHFTLINEKFPPLSPDCPLIPPEFNFDGALTSTTSSQGKGLRYCQVFRNGCVESLLCSNECLEGGTGKVSPVMIERTVVVSLRSYLVGLELLGISFPVFISLSFLNTKGVYFVFDDLDYYREKPPVYRNSLIFAGLTIQDNSDNLYDILRPTFNALWNAGGYPRSMCYDENGTSLEKYNY